MISIVTASAGTGKTWQLTRLLADMLKAGIPADRLMATTFTVKAAQELESRARTCLVEQGLSAQAHELPAALVGTIHALGAKLVARFAFELGLSPHMDVLEQEDTMHCLQEALEDVFTEEPWREGVQEAAEAFGILREEWHATVLGLVTAARANRIGPASLEAAGPRCADELAGFLDAPAESDQDESLLRLLRRVHGELSHPRLKIEHEATEVLRTTLASHERGRLPWSGWAKLSKLEGGKRWEAALQPLRRCASAFMEHPRLRLHMRRYLEGLFHFAAQGLERYRSYKETVGLLDFGDLEERLLELLDDADLRTLVSDQVRVLLVDEFQDTSPLQLAIFLRLGQLARDTVWVGDPKQSIYAFRGADQELMKACTETFPATSLTTTYRSTPSLLAFISYTFASPFAGQGIPWPPLTARRTEAGDVPVSLWGLETQNRDEDWVALATGLKAFLQEHPSLVPSSVAVLCRRRDSCRDLAGALAAAGLQVAWEQPGILRTLEGRLVEAGMRLLLDPFDTLAAATVAFLDRPLEQTAEAWLEERLRAVASETDSRAWADHPRVARLHE
ncbi:MAG TPA: UvrD-helicase domain-containing protein, partial [Candidatus Xenobia bacterium]